MRANRYVIRYRSGNRDVHAAAIACMSAAGDIAAADNSQQFGVVWVALSQIGVHIDIRQISFPIFRQRAATKPSLLTNP